MIMELAKINGLAVLKMVCSLKWMDTYLIVIKIILNDILIFKVSIVHKEHHGRIFKHFSTGCDPERKKHLKKE